RSASQSSGDEVGARMSPTISIRPLMQPKISFGDVSAGTRFDTALPFFVMIKVSLVACTSSIRRRQRALKIPAAITFMTMCYDHGHYNRVHVPLAVKLSLCLLVMPLRALLLDIETAFLTCAMPATFAIAKACRMSVICGFLPSASELI